jgi:hypothetical protein
LAFLALLFFFSYGLFYVFDKKLVGVLLSQQRQPPNRRRVDAVLKQQESLLTADIFPAADSVKVEEVKSEALAVDEKKGPLPNYNVHIFYYGW